MQLVQSVQFPQVLSVQPPQLSVQAPQDAALCGWLGSWAAIARPNRHHQIADFEGGEQSHVASLSVFYFFKRDRFERKHSPLGRVQAPPITYNRPMPWTERRLKNRRQGEKEIEQKMFVKLSESTYRKRALQDKKLPLKDLRNLQRSTFPSASG